MPWWAIIILLAFIFVGLYIAAVIIFIYQMGVYAKRMVKSLEAIDVLIVQKYDMLRLISKLFVKYDITVPPEFVLNVRPKFEETLADISPEERAIVKAFLTQTAQALFYYGEVNPQLAQHPDYIAVKERYAEIDRQYRQSVTLYNADVIGYNYWIRFGWFRWVSKWRKLTNKEVIS